jgi:hypothetical protein
MGTKTTTRSFQQMVKFQAHFILQKSSLQIEGNSYV